MRVCVYVYIGSNARIHNIAGVRLVGAAKLLLQHHTAILSQYNSRAGKNQPCCGKSQQLQIPVNPGLSVFFYYSFKTMADFPHLFPGNRYEKLTSQQLRQQLKGMAQHIYDLGRRIGSYNSVRKKTLMQKFKRQLLIYQVGYYFAFYEHLYNILMEKEKKNLIKDHSGMKVLFDKGIVKDIQDVIALREKAKRRPPEPP